MASPSDSRLPCEQVVVPLRRVLGTVTERVLLKLNECVWILWINLLFGPADSLDLPPYECFLCK